ncbi:MAG: hypothetical protein M1837_000264 [Sclerophora amabilis]|nr:MAG: hypothetical protein M1837_000264 [Sclerophora amabilis]
MPSVIGSGQRAALSEAYAAAVELVPVELRKSFILIGGASMVELGGHRNTQDVDIVATPEALDAFCTAAARDPRFSKGSTENWSYDCQAGAARNIRVPLEFLGMGGGFVPVIRAARPAQMGGFRAGLGELVLMKAHTADSRGEDKDLEDLRFLLEKMEGGDETFVGVQKDAEDLEILKDAVDSFAKVDEGTGELTFAVKNEIQIVDEWAATLKAMALARRQGMLTLDDVEATARAQETGTGTLPPRPSSGNGFVDGAVGILQGAAGVAREYDQLKGWGGDT